MSIWAAIAGGAGQYLKGREADEEEERLKRKQEFLARLEEERQMRAEQRDAERQRDRDLIQNEKEMLKEQTRLAERKEDQKRDDAKLMEDRRRWEAENARSNRYVSLQEKLSGGSDRSTATGGGSWSVTNRQKLSYAISQLSDTEARQSAAAAFQAGRYDDAAAIVAAGSAFPGADYMKDEDPRFRGER